MLGRQPASTSWRRFFLRSPVCRFRKITPWASWINSRDNFSYKSRDLRTRTGLFPIFNESSLALMSLLIPVPNESCYKNLIVKLSWLCVQALQSRCATFSMKRVFISLDSPKLRCRWFAAADALQRLRLEKKLMVSYVHFVQNVLGDGISKLSFEAIDFLFLWFYTTIVEPIVIIDKWIL